MKLAVKWAKWRNTIDLCRFRFVAVQLSLDYFFKEITPLQYDTSNDGVIEGSNDRISIKDAFFEIRSLRKDTFVLSRQGSKRGEF